MSASSTSRGIAPLLAGTAVAGIVSYLTLWVAFRGLGPDAYAPFSVFWGALYFVVGALGGVQSEITRATVALPADEAPPSPLRATAARFAVGGVVLVVVLMLAASPVWHATVLGGDEDGSLVAALAVGAGAYVIAAVVAGTLSGLGRWALVGGMSALDAILRFALVSVAVFLVATGLTPVAWAVAAPFLLTPLLALPLVLRAGIRRSRLDVGPARLVANSGSTIVAAAAMALMVSGFPMLLGFAFPDRDDAVALGAIAFAATLFRAPLVVVLQSVQGLLVVRFRERDGAREVLVVVGAIAVITVLLSLGTLWLGPWAFALIAGHGVQLSAALLAALVASSGAIAGLVAAGAAMLARRRHVVYSAGWVSAAVVTVVMMALPLPMEPRVILATITGPLVGLAVVGVAALVPRRES